MKRLMHVIAGVVLNAHSYSTLPDVISPVRNPKGM